MIFYLFNKFVVVDAQKSISKVMLSAFVLFVCPEVCICDCSLHVAPALAHLGFRVIHPSQGASIIQWTGKRAGED